MRYFLVSVSSGILFAVLDGIINANPLAQKMYEIYRPIARSSINAAAGIVIDLIYGFVLAGMFLVLYKALPGSSGLMKGVGFGLMVWFLRVVMSTATGWMIIKLPPQTVVYALVTGLLEMVILGVFYGLLLKS